MKLVTVCELGRLGDIVTSEPIFRYLKKTYPDRMLRWYTKPDFAELLRYSPDVDEFVCVKNEAEYLELKRQLPPDTVSVELNCRFGTPVTPPVTPQDADVSVETPSLLKKFSDGAGLPVPDETPVFHFRPDLPPTGLPEKYAVFHCSSNGKSRQWPDKNWKRLARMVLDSGLPVVEIGIHPQLHLDSAAFYDRTGRMDLQTAAKIIEQASFLVGIESGFGHVANAVGTFSVILSGKLRELPEYNLYCGRFRKGEGINIVRFYDIPSRQLPFETVKYVLQRLLDGHPMTQTECAQYCLKQQILQLHHAAFYRLSRLLLDPLEELRSRIAFHRIRHQK